MSGPSREQVAEAIGSSGGWLSAAALDRATNAVMALLAVPDEHRVWEGETTGGRHGYSFISDELPLPRGTRVRVVAGVD